MKKSSLNHKLNKLPNSPGVYIFKDKTGVVLYVGKATSLKDRVGSYFVGADLVSAQKGQTQGLSLQFSRRGGFGARPIEFAISQVADTKIKKTETVLEAYILEQNLIKKLQPKYNAMGKDNKSFSYVALAKEDFPRFEIMRETDLENVGVRFIEPGVDKSNPYKKIYGPYISKKQIEITLKILRKIFPYHNKKQKTEKGCLDAQIGLCPAPYDGKISQKDYAKNIRGIRMILEGRKKNLLSKMKKEMESYSEKQEFEKAATLRNQIFALQHVQDVALISESIQFNAMFSPSPQPSPAGGRGVNGKDFRIEGYDISNISGAYATGSMVVFDNSVGELAANKNEYRKFRIKTVKGSNDVAMMTEILMRRFQNNWEKPNLILLDGGAGHLNAARKVLRIFHLDIPILAVAKGPTRKKLDLRSFGTVPKIPQNILTQIRDEAHRFAISYHKKLRKNSFIS